MKSCALCRHSRRIQAGPHFWNNDCSLKQIDFPNADICSLYEPPPFPESGSENRLGFIWDNEYEGNP